MTEAVHALSEADELLAVRLTRHFNAAPERVFDAWIVPEVMIQWWGPKGISARSAEADPQPGGVIAVELVMPDGTSVRMSGVFLELDRPRRIRFELRHRQFDGADQRSEGYIPTQVDVQLVSRDGGTELTLVHSGFLHAAQTLDFTNGWNEGFDKLEVALAVV